MTKKGPLSKAEKFYIENHTDLSIDVLCRDLDRAKSTVNKFLKTLPAATQEPESSTPKSPTATMSQFARNDKGSVVMTENASIMADEHRGKRSLPPRSQRCTTKIR
jgi:hypothetical protein